MGGGGGRSRKRELLSLAPHVLSWIYKHRGRRDVNNQWAAARGRAGAGAGRGARTPGGGPGISPQVAGPPAHHEPGEEDGCEGSRMPTGLALLGTQASGELC